MKSETVLEMVRYRIVEIGHDGLYNEHGECACLLDDLAPCGCVSEYCESGVKAPCPGQGEDCFCDGECGFHIEAVSNQGHDWHIAKVPE